MFLKSASKSSFFQKIPSFKRFVISFSCHRITDCNLKKNLFVDFSFAVALPSSLSPAWWGLFRILVNASATWTNVSPRDVVAVDVDLGFLCLLSMKGGTSGGCSSSWWIPLSWKKKHKSFIKLAWKQQQQQQQQKKQTIKQEILSLPSLYCFSRTLIVSPDDVRSYTPPKCLVSSIFMGFMYSSLFNF